MVIIKATFRILAILFFSKIGQLFRKTPIRRKNLCIGYKAPSCSHKYGSFALASDGTTASGNGISRTKREALISQERGRKPPEERLQSILESGLSSPGGLSIGKEPFSADHSYLADYGIFLGGQSDYINAVSDRFTGIICKIPIRAEFSSGFPIEIVNKDAIGRPNRDSRL